MRKPPLKPRAQRKRNWHDQWEEHWKAAKAPPRPETKLRAKDPQLPPDAFFEPFTHDDIAGIIEAVRFPLVPEFGPEKLQRKLNAEVVFWFAEARAAAKEPSRGNAERTAFLIKRLPLVFEEAFGRSASANMTLRASTKLAEYDSEVDSPFVRFVRRAMVVIGQPISGGAIRDLMRGKKPRKVS